MVNPLKLDRTGKRATFLMARAAESNYNSRLRQVAKQIEQIVKGLAPDGVVKDGQIIQTLRGYADLLLPWATSVATYMVADVSRRNALSWRKHGDQMSKALRVELEHAPTGILFQQLMESQVKLITSLPLEAADRVHALSTEALMSSARADDIAKEILRTGEVSASRARLIARTEVARTASNFTQARARFAGSDGYIWRTSGDGDVRPTHIAQNGKYIRWDAPPSTDKGLAPYHAGCGPNCRCFPEPIFKDF
jgi:SPP1 gp7 family putative phage head morphogenesis protein